MVKLFAIQDGKVNFVINQFVLMIVQVSHMVFVMLENVIVNLVTREIYAKSEHALNNVIIMVFVLMEFVFAVLVIQE
jgi:hypothetical protein